MSKLIKGVNDFETYCIVNGRTELLSEWDSEKNGSMAPSDYSKSSHEYVWWNCDKGHSYRQQINARVYQKQGCPYCSGRKVLSGFNDLESKYPDLAKEWDYEKNAPLLPSEITYGSKKRVWWKCSKCENSWPAEVNNRTNPNNHTGCPYCTNQKPTKGVNDLASQVPSVAAEWDFEKNAKSPEEYTSRSSQSVFWVCPICGHHYKMSIQNRTVQHQGCPKCARRLQTSFPEQALYFYIKKVFPDAINGAKGVVGKYVLDIYIPSIKTVIEYDGPWHTYEKDLAKYLRCKERSIRLIRVRDVSLKAYVGISDITIPSHYNQGKGLRDLVSSIQELLRHLGFNDEIEIDVDNDEGVILEGYYNNIIKRSALLQHPELEEEWDQEKNGAITLDMVSSGDSHKFWWKCKICGNEWRASIEKRSTGSGCPKCARRIAARKTSMKAIEKNGSLAEKYPEIAAEWDYRKNEELTPNTVAANSNKKVWWICPKGHSFPARVADRTVKASKCPYCSGKKPILGETDLVTTHPELILDWDYEQNDAPENYTAGSNKQVHWKCHICGREWQTSVYRRALEGSGCKSCATRRTYNKE